MWVSMVRVVTISSSEKHRRLHRRGVPELPQPAHGRKPLSHGRALGYKRAPIFDRGRRMDSTLAHRNAEVRAGRRRAGARRRPFRRRPAASQPGRPPCSCARRTPAPASCRSTSPRRARRKGVLAVLTAADIKRPASRPRPPSAAQGPRRQGADPAVPADARRRARALRRRSGRHGGRGNARHRRRTPPSWSTSSTRNRRRWSTCARRSSRARRNCIPRRPTISPSTGRAWSTAPRTSARSTQIIKSARACRARHGAQPAHGGGLDGDARRHRRLRRQERQLHALRLLAERRHRAQPGRADPRASSPASCA